MIASCFSCRFWNVSLRFRGTACRVVWAGHEDFLFSNTLFDAFFISSLFNTPFGSQRTLFIDETAGKA